MDNPVLDNIYSRKSIRSYKSDPVSDDDVMMLLNAGVHAASGMNAQGLGFVIVSDREALKKYSDRGKILFLDAMRSSGNIVESIERTLSNPRTDIFYGAPVTVFIFASPKTVTPVEDASLAAGNIMLTANSIGLGTCWIGFASGLDRDVTFRAENHVPDDYRLVSTVIVGYPEHRAEPIHKNEPEILNWMR